MARPTSAETDPAVEVVSVEVDEPLALFQAEITLDRPVGTAPIEEALERLNASRLRKRVRLVVRMPSERITDASRREVADAVRRYCSERLELNGLELEGIKRDGRGTLVVAIPVFIVAAILYELFAQLRLPSVATDLLVNGIFLATLWVVVWYPAETLIFSGRRFTRINRRLAALRDADVVLEALPGSADLAGST